MTAVDSAQACMAAMATSEAKLPATQPLLIEKHRIPRLPAIWLFPTPSDGQRGRQHLWGVLRLPRLQVCPQHHHQVPVDRSGTRGGHLRAAAPRVRSSWEAAGAGGRVRGCLAAAGAGAE